MQDNQASSIDLISNSMKDLSIGLQTLDAKVDQYIRRHVFHGMEDSRQSPVKVQPEHHGSANCLDHNSPLRSMRLEVPHISGINPSAWISRIQRYFDFYNTPDSQRLVIASFHLDGDALDWYDWMHRNQLLDNWSAFLVAVEKRFGPSEFEDSLCKLCKLVQSGSLSEYQHLFEQLSNRSLGVPEHVLISCFISGLRHDLRREIQVYKPHTLVQAMGLARLFEDKILEVKSQGRTGGDFYKQERFSHHSKPSTLPPLLPTPSLPTAPGGVRAKPPFLIKKLSPAEMAARRDKGLCYNCDEKYSFGHRCQGKLFCFMIDDELEDSFRAEEEEPHDDNVVIPEISLHAMAGQVSPRTLRFRGQIGNLCVQTLVDGGSTHNFIQERVVNFLKIPILSSPNFNVLVGNCDTLTCIGYCPGVKIQLGHEIFLIDFYVLQLQGAEVVLGVQWLEFLGRVTMDYKELYMEFFVDDRLVRLQGEPLLQWQQVQFNHIRRLSCTEAISSCFQLFSLVPETASPVEVLPHSPELSHLLELFKDVFTEPKALPPFRAINHHIHLNPNSTPVNVRPYRYPHSQKSKIEKLVSEMLVSGVIRPSQSSFSSPVLLVKKKEGTWRFCVDYRALNQVTIKDRFPIPTIDELLDELHGASIFSKIDLRSGYHQIRVHPRDVHKTAFRTHEGHYEFVVMPFGLTNAPATFQASMNSLFQPFLRKFVIVSFDDILVFCTNITDHLNHLHLVLDCLRQHSFFAKRSKCSFAQSSIDYLGHIVSVKGVEPDPSKILAIHHWPTPSTVKALRGFLGLTGFYRRFVGYAHIPSPLTDILKKDQFLWSSSAQASFDNLKLALTQAPNLALPDFSVPFQLQTDASGSGIGAVLLQHNHPIAYFSKKLSPRMARASTYVRELFAVSQSVSKWRQYLIGHYFTIITDHQSLRDILNQAIHTPEQQKYLIKLLGFDFDVKYKPGKTNIVADALSREFGDTPETESFLLAITAPLSHLTTEIRSEVSVDPFYSTLLKKATTSGPYSALYQYRDGLIYRN
ncbi:uncharacterized protein LOC142519678 [Primulina tabacum]|uniref:uncharacterized protein LOC142519678 n=1 Tax=Primulina tabacum TaxID=48773 RepID=UPI003F59F2AB